MPKHDWKKRLKILFTKQDDDVDGIPICEVEKFITELLDKAVRIIEDEVEGLDYGEFKYRGGLRKAQDILRNL